MPEVFRAVRWPMASLTGWLLSSWLLAGCSGMPAPRPPAAQNEPGHATAYVVRRGWHIDIGFSTADLGGPLAQMTGEFPGAVYLLFGFGDRRYLQSRHQAPALLEALWRGPGVVLVTGLQATPAAAFGRTQVIPLSLTDEQMTALQAWVAHSLAAEEQRGEGQPAARPLPVLGPYRGSLYYRSTLTYSALHTCNTWAAEALMAAGQPVHSVGVLFAGQLWRQL